jgi:hypothetical protein
MEGLKNEKELGNWANLGQTTRMSSRCDPSVLVEDRFPLWQADCKQLLLHLARPTYVGGV